MDRKTTDEGKRKIACILITHLRAKLEMRRNPQLRDRPAVITGRSQGRTMVIDHFPAAQGVTPGMTPEQALSRQAGGMLIEADEPHYRREFHRVLEMLQGVSDRVEGAELGSVYVGLDGLEAMYGGEARLVNTLLNAVPQDLAPRAGVGHAKFPAYVAARTSAPMGAARVPTDMAAFLAPQQVELLPLSLKVLDDLHRFGLHTLGDVAALNIDAMTDRFGIQGLRAWELAQGIDETPLIPIRTEERIVQQTALPMASGSLDLLLAAVDTLLRRAYAQPRMQGRYAGHAALECAIHRAPPWEKQFRFKQAVGDWGRASRILRGQLQSDHPQAPVEEATLALSGITRESGVQMSLLPNQRGDLERRLDQAERQLQAKTDGRPVLHRIIPVAHWHPAPELRAMQVPMDPGSAGGMKQLSLPSSVTVQEGPGGEPREVMLGGRWHRVARTLDTWCFDLWWMLEPLTRTYHRVEWDEGGDETLFQDGRNGLWYRQDP